MHSIKHKGKIVCYFKDKICTVLVIQWTQKKRIFAGTSFFLSRKPQRWGVPRSTPNFHGALATHSNLSPGLIPRLKAGRIVPWSTLSPLMPLPWSLEPEHVMLHGERDFSDVIQIENLKIVKWSGISQVDFT